MTLGQPLGPPGESSNLGWFAPPPAQPVITHEGKKEEAGLGKRRLCEL